MMSLAGMPTIEEVCSTFGLTDVEMEYTETDYQNLTTYKLFQQHVRPLLAKENPKVCNKIIIVNQYFSIRFLVVGTNVEIDDVSCSKVARIFKHEPSFTN